MEIKTNNVPREILHAWDLSKKERNQYDYINWEAVERGEESADFVRYKGTLHDLNDMEQAAEPFKAQGWQYMVTETFFSGVLFKWVQDDSSEWLVVCGRYYT